MRSTEFENDKSFYHIVTMLICLGIILLASIILLVRYVALSVNQSNTENNMAYSIEYNDSYFSDRILEGVTVSGIDVGGMTVEEAKQYLSGNVSYNIKLSEILIRFEDKSWLLGKDVLKLTVDVDHAAKQAYRVGRFGTDQERTDALQKLKNGEKIDISATIMSEPELVMAELNKIKAEVDIKKKDATVTFKYDNAPVFTYTDEAVGRSLNLQNVYGDIAQLVKAETQKVEYALVLDVVEPDVRRADIEKNYSLVSTFTTTLSASSSQGRIQNITTALNALDERVWMPGQTFSFNQWVGARTIENGFGLGVFINEDQMYDEVVGGGICQVSTTIYYSALLAGANSVGRNAPIEIIERRPHTWPSEYISRGLDATVSWPHTDLKLYNNNRTPYFFNTSIVRSGSKLKVTVEFYGMPLPNNAKIQIETETIEELAPGAPQYFVDTTNKYHLQPGQHKEVSKARTGYTVNVYQIWTEEGKEPVKSLLTVSKYAPISAKVYVATEADLPQNVSAVTQ